MCSRNDSWLSNAGQIVGNEHAVEIVIRHRESASGTVIDLERIGLFKERAEEIVCRDIERTAMEAFRYPYGEMFKKHFGEES